MDLLLLSIILAAAILAVVLLRGRDRHSPGGKESEFPISSIPHTRSGKWCRTGIRHSLPTSLFVGAEPKQYRLLNDAEQILYFRLREALPSMEVFAQVGIAQLAQLRGRQEARRLNPLAGRGVDFIVCGADFGIVAAIELAWPTDDNGENSPEEEKRRALHSLGIPLIVYRPNDLPDSETLSQEITGAIVRRNRPLAEHSAVG